MATDVTAKVLGQNADGSLNVQLNSGNPFGGSGSAMVPAAAARQFTMMVGGQTIAFASEADLIRAQIALQNMGGGAPNGMGSTPWLGIASNAASALNNFFARANIDRKIQDYKRVIALQNDAKNRLGQLSSRYPDLIPLLTEMFDQERRATEIAVSAMEDLLTANGVAVGVDVVRLANDFLDSRNSNASLFGQSSGSGGTLLAAGAGLGLGLLASRSNSDR